MKREKNKKIIFVTNFFNHHQRPLSDELYEIYGKQYMFLATQEMDEERKRLGWKEESYPSYVINNNEFSKNRNEYIKKINDADVVIIGSVSYSLFEKRIRDNKLTFYYSERLLKHNDDNWKYFIRLITWRKKYPQKNNSYVLCASAYTSADFNKYGMFKNKCFKWGYFTEVKEYEDINNLLQKKKKNSILWAGRLIDWKHPEIMISLAKELKTDGYEFDINIIGSGPLEEKLRIEIKQCGLSENVHLFGSMSPENVRVYMENSSIYLFTSDRNEGWGAVLNESMNSACAVVANHVIGAVPYLIKDGKNGLIYRDGNLDELYEKVKWLINHDDDRINISKKAYLTIINDWNPKIAAKRLSDLIEVLNDTSATSLFDSGICSKAEILKDRWYEEND